MHLSTCTNITEEERMSRSLLDEILSLRVNRIMNGTLIPMNTMLRGDDRPQRANPRYLIMVNLRRRVWKKIGWDSDGKGIDPWGGRLPCASEEEVAADLDKEGVDSMEFVVPEQGIEGWNGNWGAESTTGLEQLDTILAGDPMDLFQWDEWESLATEFFAS